MTHANEWISSGISLRNYAQNIGVTKSKLGYWVRKLKNSHDSESPNSQFVDISTLAESVKPTNDESQLPISPPPQIVLTLPSGLVLKVYS